MIEKGTKLKEKPKSACLFYATGTKFKNEYGPRCTLTTYTECNPETCPWYRTQEMADASFEKARQIWAKNHGRDDYYQLGYGPKKRCLPRTNTDEEEEENVEHC